MLGKGAVRAEKGFTLFISNEDMNDVIKIIKLLEDLDVIIDGVTETVTHEIKKQEGEVHFLEFVSTFSHYNSATSDFFSSKRYKWKRS